MNKQIILISIILFLILVLASLWSGTSWYNDICHKIQQGQTNYIPPYALGLRDSGFENCSINRLIINPFIYLPGFFLVIIIIHAYMVTFQKKQTVSKNLINIVLGGLVYLFLTKLLGFVFPYIYSNPMEGQYVSLHNESVFASFSLTQNIFLVIPIAILLLAYSQIGVVIMAFLYKRFYLSRGYKPNLIIFFFVFTSSLFIQGFFVFFLIRSYAFVDSINRPKVIPFPLRQYNHFENVPITKKVTIQATVAPANLSDWKRYTSNDGMFSFQYPDDGDWKIVEYERPIGKSISALCEKCMSATINSFEVSPVTFKSNEEYLSEKTAAQQVNDYQITESNSIEVLRMLQPGAPSRDAHIEIFMMNDSQGYVISESFINQGDKTKITNLPQPYPDIFSTFRFLK